MNKNIWIIANWKSNKNIQEALDWISVVGPQIPKSETLKVVICPTFDCLSEVKKAIQVGNYSLTLGSQDISPFGIGAYTGEEPAEILKQLVDVAIIGHSERRTNFNETDETVAKKVTQAKAFNINPLVCVQNAETAIPEGCNLIAYEPIFAIGTGTPDTPENADNVAKNIKQKYGEVAVLYGGSVTSNNIKSFIYKENINGVLIGSASLDAREFVKIIKECTGETD